MNEHGWGRAPWGLGQWIGIVAVYLLFNVATQLWASPTANYDQAEMLVLTQDLRLGYTAQPPLYVWLNWGVEQLAGPGLLLNLLLKCALMTAGIGIALATLRHAGGTSAQAALVLAGFALIPVAIWESQRVLTHTSLAVMLVLATLWQAQRLRSSPTWFGYLAWGVLGGGAFIAKYNAAIALTALVGALLLARAWRALILDRRLVWAAVGAALMVLPHLLWLLTHLTAVGPTVRKLERSEGPFAFTAGLAELAGALAACVGVMTLVWLFVLLGRLVRRTAPAGAGSGEPANPTGPGATATEVGPGMRGLHRLVSLQLLLGLLLTAAFVVVSGSRHFEERWLLPVLAPLPLWLALTVVRSDLRRGLLVAGGLMALLAALLLPGRVLFAEHLARGKPAVVSQPYAELARQLRAAYGEPVRILADTQTLGGNLRLSFPGASILVPGVTAEPLPTAGPLWVVLEDSDCEGWARSQRLDAQALTPLPDVRCRVHEAPLLHLPGQSHRLHVQVLR